MSRDGLGFIWTKFQPKRTIQGPFRTSFLIFWQPISGPQGPAQGIVPMWDQSQGPAPCGAGPMWDRPHVGPAPSGTGPMWDRPHVGPAPPGTGPRDQ